MSPGYSYRSHRKNVSECSPDSPHNKWCDRNPLGILKGLFSFFKHRLRRNGPKRWNEKRWLFWRERYAAQVEVHSNFDHNRKVYGRVSKPPSITEKPDALWIATVIATQRSLVRNLFYCCLAKVGCHGNKYIRCLMYDDYYHCWFLYV